MLALDNQQSSIEIDPGIRSCKAASAQIVVGGALHDRRTLSGSTTKRTVKRYVSYVDKEKKSGQNLPDSVLRPHTTTALLGSRETNQSINQ